MAHGGIVCTILDEVMAWALVAEDNWGVTARMNVDVPRPVPIGRPIRAEGWIDPVAPAGRRDRPRARGRRRRHRAWRRPTGTYVAADEAAQARAP